MAEKTDDRIRLTLSRSTGFTLDVDLTLPNGGVTVLFGVSGCGKTTVLRSAAGLEKAKGYVRIAGQVWQDDEKRIFVPTYERRIGYVFQEASLFDHLNVRENLRFGLKRISARTTYVGAFRRRTSALCHCEVVGNQTDGAVYGRAACCLGSRPSIGNHALD